MCRLRFDSDCIMRLSWLIATGYQSLKQVKEGIPYRKSLISLERILVWGLIKNQLLNSSCSVIFRNRVKRSSFWGKNSRPNGVGVAVLPSLTQNWWNSNGIIRMIALARFWATRFKDADSLKTSDFAFCRKICYFADEKISALSSSRHRIFKTLRPSF